MELQCCPSHMFIAKPTNHATNTKCNLIRFPRKVKPPKFTCLVNIGLDDIAQVAHNKVLVAAAASAAIGQLTKPFTSVILYGKNFDFKTAFQAGGFPSTHSSSVVATATSLALERGFSDSIFGLTLIYAGLVMYDAQIRRKKLKCIPFSCFCSSPAEVTFDTQSLLRTVILEEYTTALAWRKGVRREVGNHAKVLNRVLRKRQVNLVVVSKDRDNLIDFRGETGGAANINNERFGPLLTKKSSTSSKSAGASVLVGWDKETQQSNEAVGFLELIAEEGTESDANTPPPLKESIGHTEFEVVAGAFLGFLVSLAVFSVM